MWKPTFGRATLLVAMTALPLAGATVAADYASAGAPRKRIKLPGSGSGSKSKSKTRIKPKAKRRRFKVKRQKRGGKSQAAPTQGSCTVKTSEIINTKVSIGAQYSLMRKMGGDLRSRLDASSMLKAIEDGRLAGIFLPPIKAVSDRGKRMSPQKGYWDLIPKGKNSMCLKKPTGEAPMILYRTKMTPQQIDRALTSAWQECGILNLPVPCEYTVDRHKPQLECTTDSDCITSGKGDYCNTASNTCGTIQPTKDPVPAVQRCPQPLCDANVVTDVFASCGFTGAGVPIECVPRAGKACGVCEGVSPASQKCLKENNKRARRERAKCVDEQGAFDGAKFTVECGVHLKDCRRGDLLACADLSKCFVAPAPAKKFEKCQRDESERGIKEGERCRGL